MGAIVNLFKNVSSPFQRITASIDFFAWKSTNNVIGQFAFQGDTKDIFLSLVPPLDTSCVDPYTINLKNGVYLLQKYKSLVAGHPFSIQFKLTHIFRHQILSSIHLSYTQWPLKHFSFSYFFNVFKGSIIYFI